MCDPVTFPKINTLFIAMASSVDFDSDGSDHPIARAMC